MGEAKDLLPAALQVDANSMVVDLVVVSKPRGVVKEVKMGRKEAAEGRVQVNRQVDRGSWCPDPKDPWGQQPGVFWGESEEGAVALQGTLRRWAC